eukprot:TRINITY_DN49579_c0_g1_i1.p1 TRINITY_DN49579_c0_g1~~TRINITY_DN49579_c0_g1_i1.p1  ORF type:complete len:990 (+),score=235.40 TRINITY_DN49579_c0_g1_i1:38-3007(+)
MAQPSRAMVLARMCSSRMPRGRLPAVLSCFNHARGVTASSPSTSSSAPRAGPFEATGSGNGQLWDLLEYNAHYFNPHRMASLLAQVLEEPRVEARGDARLQAYLQKATSSAQLYENLKDLTAKDIALTVSACREVGHPAAEDLSDVLVATVASQLARLDLVRVSFFITAFAKRQIDDTRFWRAAARAVADSEQHLTPQVLVSLFDAFRKSGLRSERLFQALCRRVYHVLDDLGPAHIPPIVATICRVPLKAEDREQALRAVLSRWLLMLRHEQEQPTGAITIQQILSLSVSLGLAPEEVNTTVFARDVSAFIGSRFDLLGADEIIVFLWAYQRLILPGSSTAFLAQGLSEVHHIWTSLMTSSQLSLQRLTQLSDVLVCTKHEAKGALPHWTPALEELQELVIQDLGESVQYCQSDGLAEILEIWSGSEVFWHHHLDFAEAIAKRAEELLLESQELEDVRLFLQAAVGAPGLVQCLPRRAVQALEAAIRSRGPADVERVRALLAGSPWEALCGSTGSASSSAAKPDSPEAAASAPFRELLESWRRPRTDLELADFLREALLRAKDGEEALQALEAAAPFAQRLAAIATGEVLQHLEALAERVAEAAAELPSARLVASWRACAVAGLPHAQLFAASTSYLGSSLSAMHLVEALESCAVLRLSIPELRPWLEGLLDQGLERRLPAGGLARLLAAAARLSLLQADEAESLLQRMVTVASPVRPLPIDTLATLCLGLSLLGWSPSAAGSELWQVASWLEKASGQPRSPSQALALRHFTLALLAEPAARAAVQELPPDLQRALAGTVRGPSAPPSRRPLASDTTLKFRHEVAEVLRKGGEAYDLDLGLGPGLSVELALPGAGNALWLLDGPEAFHRPFLTNSAGGRAMLNLVPLEVLRSRLLTSILTPGSVDAMEAALESWEQLPKAAAQSSTIFGISERIVQARKYTWPPQTSPEAATQLRLARLHWLEWERLPPEARLAALLKPEPRLVARGS